MDQSGTGITTMKSPLFDIPPGARIVFDEEGIKERARRIFELGLRPWTQEQAEKTIGQIEECILCKRYGPPSVNHKGTS